MTTPNDQPEFPEILATPHAVNDPPPPPRPTMWIIVGYWRQGWWGLPSAGMVTFRKREEAIEAIEKHQENGWRHLHIVEIPGDVTEAPRPPAAPSPP